MAMNPILKEVAKKVTGKAKIIKIDVDKYAKIGSNMGVMGVPTFMIFKNGKKLWHEAGTKTAKQLEDIILKNI